MLVVLRIFKKFENHQFDPFFLFQFRILNVVSLVVNTNDQTLLDMYSDGHPLGFGIGVGGERWREQRKFAAKVLSELSERRKGAMKLSSSFIAFEFHFSVLASYLEFRFPSRQIRSVKLPRIIKPRITRENCIAKADHFQFRFIHDYTKIIVNKRGNPEVWYIFQDRE